MDRSDWDHITTPVPVERYEMEGLTRSEYVPAFEQVWAEYESERDALNAEWEAVW